MKVTHTIVNSNRQLVGLVVDNNGDVRAFTITELKNAGFKNKQLHFNESGMLVECDDFKLNSIPMKVIVGNGYIDINNNISLVGRIVCNNENIGFTCQFADGSSVNMRYNDILTLSHWFKPSNFIIKTSKSGKHFIAGNNGTVLDKLPAIFVDNGQTTKRTKPAAKETTEGVDTKMQQNIDIMDLFSIVRKYQGYIIKLPSEAYHITTDNKYVDNEFKALNFGEVASPYININPEKLNAYASFKKLGKVNINGNELITFKTTNKCIFNRLENHIQNFGIAVDKQYSQNVLTELGKTLAIEQITDADFINVMNHVLNSQTMQYFKVDTSKIELLSADKKQGAILDGDELYKLVNNIYELKIVRKAFDTRGKYMKDLKALVTPSTWAEMNGKEVFYAFKGYTDAQLQILIDHNIDIYTGGYTSKGEYKGSSKVTDNTSFTEKPIELRYAIAGRNIDKISASDIQIMIANNDPKLGIGSEYRDMLNKVYTLGSPDDILRAIKEVNKKVNEALFFATLKLWKHNITMLEYSDFKKIHQKDKDSWHKYEETRAKNYEVIQYMDTSLLCEFVGLSF